MKKGEVYTKFGETYVHKETYIDVLYEDNYPLHEVEEHFGYLILPKDHNVKCVNFRGEDLYLGNFKVEGFDKEVLKRNVPSLYVLREEGIKYSNFVCGLDLKASGKIWEGATNKLYNTVEDAVKEVERVEGCKVVIYQEEMMRC